MEFFAPNMELVAPYGIRGYRLAGHRLVSAGSAKAGILV
jgi:hypothetical protein